MKRQFQIDGIRIQLYEHPEPGFVLPGETCDSWQLLLINDGHLHSIADGTELLLSPGDLVLYHPGQWLMLYADMDEAPCFLRIHMESDGRIPAHLTRQKLPATQDVNTLLSRILLEHQCPDAYSTDYMTACLEMLMLTILRQQDSLPAPEIPIAQGEKEIIRRAQQHISIHVRDRLTVPSVAGSTGISPSYLTALFQKHLGISPGEYIRRVKLHESKRLIREGKLNFTEIAAALSYSTVHHFSRQFKDKFGISPTEYAKSWKPPEEPG